jgi:hypothetical protein
MVLVSLLSSIQEGGTTHTHTHTCEMMVSMSLLFSMQEGGTTRGEVYMGDWGS